jgi:hypothetical protein
MGFEPMNTGFADQRVSHFAIGARCCQLSDQARHTLLDILYLIAHSFSYDCKDGKPEYFSYLIYFSSLCYRKVFLRQVPALYIKSAAAAPGALGGVFDGYRSGNDNLLARPPVCWTRHVICIGGLQCLEEAKDLIDVSPNLHRVVDERPDIALWVDGKCCTDRCRVRSRLMDQTVGCGDLLIEIGDERELHLDVANLL